MRQQQQQQPGGAQPVPIRSNPRPTPLTNKKEKKKKRMPIYQVTRDSSRRPSNSDSNPYTSTTSPVGYYLGIQTDCLFFFFFSPPRSPPKKKEKIKRWDALLPCLFPTDTFRHLNASKKRRGEKERKVKKRHQDLTRLAPPKPFTDAAALPAEEPLVLSLSSRSAAPAFPGAACAWPC